MLQASTLHFWFLQDFSVFNTLKYYANILPL